MSQSAHEFLASHELLTVATASANGVPHATPVFYVSEGSTVWFSCSDATQTGKNLAENRYASIAVADAPDEGEDWSHARGIQLWGPVEKLGHDDPDVTAKFKARYPHLDEPTGAPFYKLTPDEVHYIHNDEDGDEDFEALGVHWIRETL